MHVGCIRTGFPAMRLAASSHNQLSTTCIAAATSPRLCSRLLRRPLSTTPALADPGRARPPASFAASPASPRWPPDPPRPEPGRCPVRELSSQGRFGTIPNPTNDDVVGGYGKWQWLLMDSARALKESSPVGGHLQMRLINRPGAGKDLALWACLLDVCHRTGNEPGASFLVDEVFRRRQLCFQDHHPLSSSFWGTVLEVSLRDERLLIQLWVYAEWMRVAHGVKWPMLYDSVMRALLVEDELEKAFRWHLRLVASFGPDRAEFVRLLTGFVMHNSNNEFQALLRSIYASSPHRDLYDTLIPSIWNMGQSNVARFWRHVLVRHSDLPKSDAAHVFIKYILAYFPDTRLTEEEKRAIRSEEELVADDLKGGDVRTIINRVHGKTFGIPEKPYDDSLGARWFASTWVSLDTALHLVHALGVRSIGPLSLQSIALREPTLDSLARRLEQLESLGMGTGSSRYSAAVRHFVAQRDEESLRELLASDIHPDVYDDPAAQKEILDASSRSGDWKTYRLILSVRSAEGHDHISLGFNDLILFYLHSGRQRMVLAVLAEMSSRGIPVLAGTSSVISQYLIHHASQSYDTRRDHDDFFIALGRRMMETPYPLASGAWALLLRSLGRRYKFEQLENLSMEIIRHYREADATGAYMMNIPTVDVPDMFLHQYSRKMPFQQLPADLPITNPRHPIQTIFGPKFQAVHIYRTFRFVLLYPQGWNGQEGLMAAHTIARGVKFLSELKMVGVNVHDNIVRLAVTESLVDLFGFDWTPRKNHIKVAWARNRLPLPLVRDIFNRAWGAEPELLPPLEELKALIDKAALRRLARRSKIKKFFTETAPWLLAPPD